MSNLWKLYGLAYSNPKFFEEATILANDVRPRDFTRDPENNDPYHQALATIDKFLFKWCCPLGHLDAQLFYDLLCCQTLWNNFANVLNLTNMDTSEIAPGDPEASVFWQVLGLSCLDPWRNADRGGDEHTGFRHLLRRDVNVARDFGFELSARYKEMLAQVLATPQILEALEGIAMCWLPTSKSMVMRREEYPRLAVVEVPPGWIDLTQP